MPNYGAKEQLYKDVLTNWVETGSGLWAAQIMRRRDADLNVLECRVQDAEDEDEPIHTVTLDTIQTGFNRIMKGEVKALHESCVKHITQRYRENDADLDADDCDIIVQAGLFNEIIYS